MRIDVDWPRTGLSISIAKTYHRDNVIAFDMMNGQFLTDNQHIDRQVILFYWSGELVVMVNKSPYFTCLIDDKRIPINSVSRLYDGCILQAGHYKLTCRLMIDEDSKPYSLSPTELNTIDQWRSLSLNKDKTELPGFGGFKRIRSLQYTDDSDVEQDVINELRSEFSQYILLKEQGRDYSGRRINKAILAKEEFFIGLNEKVKDKTLTSCILGVDNLGALFFKEIEGDILNDEFFNETIENRKEILSLVSDDTDEEISSEVLPDLILEDFFKVSLDSTYE